MNFENLIKQGLHVQGLPIYEPDIPYIHQILYTINQAETSISSFPSLNKEVPITVVDKGVVQWQTYPF